MWKYRKVKHIFRRFDKKNQEVRDLVRIPASFDVMEMENGSQENNNCLTATQYLTSKYITMFTVLFCSMAICMCLIYLPGLIETYYKNKIKYTRWALLLSLVTPASSSNSIIPSSLGILVGFYNWFCWLI
ncbi:hypothetical protein RNJ44_01254 [Nakaseomyces bracarensis]|uniref:Uncharacterized protein n=1 Tax=Nakaseomyces bracarensis TaxID=273131 RepID=A0ABR4NRB8_9SACH